MMQRVETPEPQSRPPLFRRLALRVGYGIVSSLATGCSPGAPSPTTSPSSIARASPSSSPALPYSDLQGVTCAGANDCWAVGFSGIGGTAASNPLIEHYAGNVWAPVSAPSPIEGQLYGVTCVSAGDCWAVGEAGLCVEGPPLIEHYSGDGWAIVASPNPGRGILYGVTCASATDCWAVGGAYYLADAPPLIEHYAGDGWAIVSSLQFSNHELYDVACVSAGDCWAVGGIVNPQGLGGSTPGTQDALPLVARYTGSGWAIVITPNRGPGNLAGVTCAGGGGCWAVGSLSAASSPPLIEHDLGTGWAVSTPDPSPADLSDIACPSVGECWAVGSSASSKPLIERHAGSRWAVVSNAAPNTAPGAGSGSLEGVTCASANDCWAVGHSGGPDSDGQMLIEHYSGSSWTIFGRQ
jgi:hypothetical protein